MLAFTRPFNRLACVLATFVGGAALAQEGSPIESGLTASLDQAVDWNSPFSLSVKAVEETFVAEGYKSSPYYVFIDKGKQHLRMGRKPYDNVTVDLTAMDGALTIESAVIEFSGGTAKNYLMDLAGDQEASALACKTRLDQSLGVEGSLRYVASPSIGRVQFTTWETPTFVAVLTTGGKAAARLGIALPEERHRLYVFNEGSEIVLSLDLDFLLDLPAAWKTSPSKLDQRLNVPGIKEQVFFQWMTEDKSRARFASRPFSNVMVALSLFGGRLPIEELLIDFDGDAVKQMTFSAYNRGDTGEISVQEFEKIYKTCGQALGQALKVAPKRQPSNAASAIKTVGWMWTSPEAVALMEYNDFEDPSSRANPYPEFLRVKIAPPHNLDWNFGVTQLGARTTTVSRSSLEENVTRAESGDVYVNGLPMVDQGDKGYCVVASCQRLFEYFHIPCDQHEMALLVGADAQRGTNSRVMEEALDKIDNRFKTRFKPLIHTQMDARERGRLDVARFIKYVKENVDEGLPLLWALELGVFPEEPPLPGAGQTSGGHMRMIIGYNEQRGDVLFSDSWGAGHELKRMNAADAFRATSGLYLMLPRTL